MVECKKRRISRSFLVKPASNYQTKNGIQVPFFVATFNVALTQFGIALNAMVARTGVEPVLPG